MGDAHIRRCTDDDFDAILAVINDAAEAYRGVIPADRWHEPYMSAGELRAEMGAGVEFSCWEASSDEGEGRILGVMGVQDVDDVTLIRHAYVRTDQQGRGIGRALLERLLEDVDRRVLIGTWAAATWAIRFYEANGFRLVDVEEKERLLRRYWDIPERQVETSVVLAS